MGLLSKKDVYDDFIEGAKEGFKVVIDIMPTLIGLMVAVGVLRASGPRSLANLINPIMKIIRFPES